MTQAGAGAGLWADALMAAALFAVDPAGLGGVAVRAAPGPVRDRWSDVVRGLLAPSAPVRRIPLNIEDDRLLGGLDLAASLAAGRAVAQRGVLADCDGGVAVLPMAERITDAVGARLAAVMDQGEVAVERDGLALRLPARIGLIALDEGLEPPERPPEAVLERLALRITLNGVGARDLSDCPYDAVRLAEARAALAGIAPADGSIVAALCEAAQAFGAPSIRAPILALAVARAHAALMGRRSITDEDAAVAARLVLGPRALTAPGEAEPPPSEGEADAPPEPPPESSDASSANPPDQPPPDSEDGAAPPTEMIIAAIKAALPEDLLDRVSQGQGPQSRAAPARGSGAQAKSARRGRPIGSRAGALRAGDRLNLVETLRAAAPWQRLRRAAGADAAARVQVRKDDFRIRRFVQRADATTIFVVDASGSAAFQRLAEAKGAVELLLAKVYVTRTRVALIAFRDKGAELLLPPTRSLTRAKRRLADLPGGGGTPLASGVDEALLLALAEKAKDRTPTLVFLTDGRANIGRGGAPGRAAAQADAMEAAQRVRAAGIGAVFIDTSSRAQPGGDALARAMGAVYAPLPYVDAQAVQGLVSGAAMRR